MKKILCLLILIPFIGCASMGDKAQFYQAQKEFMEAQNNQKPLFEMKATPGKSIENLASLMVYMPSQGQLKDFKQYSEAHPAWETANTLLRVGGQIAGIYFIVDGVKSLFGTFESLGKQPHSIVTNTNSGNTATSTSLSNNVAGTGNAANLGSGSANWSNINTSTSPVVVVPPVFAP